MQTQNIELSEILTHAAGDIWSALGTLVPAELRPWVLLAAAISMLWLVMEIVIYSRPGRSVCGARTKKEGHCRRPVTNGGPCGAPGHGSGWVGQNVLLVVFVVALGGHMGGLF